MKKKIEDYLHLYLGCKVKYGYALESIGRLIGKTKQGWQVEPIYNPLGVVHGVRDELLKPIVRPLSDMTEDEADHFAWLCMSSEHHLGADSRVSQDEIQTELIKNDGGLMLDGDVEIYIGVTVRCFEGAVLIKTDGSISVYDKHNESYQSPDDIAYKVVYLLSKGFDLFGLIPAGLAIDSTTLTPAT